jgi:uncharacterized protein (TIGR02594 family)
LQIKFILIPALLFGQACTATNPTKMPDHSGTVLLNSIAHLNSNERSDRAELTEFMDVDPVRTEWCAAFMNAVLEKSNIPSLNTIGHKYPLTARGFLDWGTEVEYPLPGDLVIFPRGNQGWQGHVGIFLEVRIINDKKYFMILGGNQDNSVSIKPYLASSAISIRRWDERWHKNGRL